MNIALGSDHGGFALKQHIKDYLDSHKDQVDQFMQDYAASSKFVNEEQNQAAALIEKYEIMANAALAKKAIDNCNIVCITGEEMQKAASAMLQVLYDSDPSSVGGALPDEAFYMK